MKNRILNNLGLKIGSIIIAILLWLTITNIDDPTVTETYKNIPVTITHDEVISSRGYGYTVENGETTTVKVKGRRSLVESIKTEDFTACADFNNMSSMYMVPITVTCATEHVDELVMTLQNENMAIRLEDQVTQPFMVRVITNGKVRDGYYCTENRVSAGLIQVTGSTSSVNSVKELVVKVDLEGRMTSFTDQYEIIAYDSEDNEIDTRKLTFSQNSVEVATDICPIKQVPIEVVTVGDPAEGYYVENVEFAPHNITIAAGEALLKRLNKFNIEVDVSGSESTIEQAIDLNEYLSNNYQNTYIPEEEGQSLGVIVTVKPFAEKKFEIGENDIEIRNLSEKLDGALYSLWNANVVISGAETDIADVTVDDLNLYIDVAECNEGTYTRQMLTEYEGPVRVHAGSVMVKLTAKDNYE